ncbi:MAG: GntR family transcriptional regulator [Pseudomonadota bacterium]|uniref:DNA-binding transcriptional regulator, GntR family n=1 Tax=Thalassococcus halodurans TaxID=373675 RepID=A0A1H6BGW7_9RHOB|nr:GntR family transcriptional regulator [Thalassococcus halodurans]MEE3361198.1 GntR family transcriptional regulator [Pseudomonadota bacterium]SEG60009.1 DNA-binding transcriptional regulator, GntR family [Thalassococcus halodurans]
MLDQTPKKSDDIAHQLASRIVRCEVSPGEKLRQDLVAREFGVSQVTVREAFLRLEGQGLVISLPRRGTCVASMDQKTAEELKVMRVALEPVALERSVPNLTPEQVQDIEDAQDACDFAETVEDWEDANRRFHLAVIAGCDMPRLVAEIAELQVLYSWHYNMHYAGRWKKRADRDHAAILAAIKEGDAATARIVMQRHLSRLS